MNAMIDIIAGARPNFMKIGPIIHAIQARQKAGSRLTYRLVHTGQHYDNAMSGAFFTQLQIPEPDVNLEVGSGTQAEQTAAIMIRYENLLRQKKPAVCLVVGDVTSTMATAITARKLCVPVAHVEAGIRSGDWTMPEEVNRVVTDSLTTWFFTTSAHANENLTKAGVDPANIFFVGNTMIDTLLSNLPRLQPPALWAAAGLQEKKYFVLTLHRPSNVDNPASLKAMLDAVAAAAEGLPVIFPVHPRSAAVLKSIPQLPDAIRFVDPQPYLEFMYLVKGSLGVITDSGGITEETTVLGIPCMTLRDSTERPETVAEGTNELLGTSPAAIAPAMKRLIAGEWKTGRIPEKWDGQAGRRIVAELETLLAADEGMKGRQ